LIDFGRNSNYIEIVDKRTDDKTVENTVVETVDQTEEFEEELNENCSRGLTTDEIIAMYDNVELNLDDNDIISVEDIIKIYDTSKTVEESFPIKKISRNRKNSETLCGSNLTKCF
jgi:hypothetical protein